MEERGLVFNIQHACDHDGPGIRTTVFLKGCSLRCRWCHNPESWSSRPQILFDAVKCIGCGRCVQVCPQKCHSIRAGIHSFDRWACLSCGACASVCPSALDRCGREMSVSEVMEQVLEDRVFYESTGGGITVSGGEPLEQSRFTQAILAEAKKCGLHTCLETSANGDQTALLSLLPYVDLLLLDYKLSSTEEYVEWTASDGARIQSNIERLLDMDIPIWLRCPFVPEVHTPSHFAAVADTANRMIGVQKIQIMPYHKMGLGKYDSMGELIPMDAFSVPSEAQIRATVEAVQSKTKISVMRG